MGNYNTLNQSCTQTPNQQLPFTRQFSSNLWNYKSSNKDYKQIRLSHFKSHLLKQQCFYVLRSLVQQYYLILRQNGKVVVSDYICHVTSLGEVKVGMDVNKYQHPLSFYGQITNIFVTILSEILQLVTSLAIDKEWIRSRQCSSFHDKLTKSIYKYHSKEELLYQEVLKQINRFMEQYHMKTNLIPAILRKQSQASQDSLFFMQDSAQYSKTPYLPHTRSRSQSQLASSAEHPFISRFSISGEEEISSMGKVKDNSTKVDYNIENNVRASLSKPNKRSLYKHKMVRTQGETYFNHMLSLDQKRNSQYEKNQTYFEEMPPTERPVEKQSSYQCSNFSKISPQFSINILNSFHKDKNNSGGQKVKFSRFQEKLGMKQVSSGYESWHPKRTSIQQLGSNITSNSKVYTKSVLDQLARQVQVRDQPNSRDYIS